MKVSKRQRQIIELLIERKNELTVAEIAREIQVSSRTIHRGLMEIEAILGAYGIILHKKAGKGLQIYAEREQLNGLQSNLAQSSTTEYSAEERQVLLACRLLEMDEPVKLFSLSRELRAAVPTISNDLDELDQWVRKYGLTLVRRRGYGVEITGTERAKRKAISTLAQDYLDDSALFGSEHERQLDAASSRLVDMVGREPFFQIEKAFWKLDNEFATTRAEEAYTYLLMQLSIAVTRIGRGKLIEAEEILEHEWTVSVEERRKYELLADVLKLQLPPQEEVAVIALLKGMESTLDPDQGVLFHEDLHQVEWVSRMIRHVGEQLFVDFTQDRSLKEGLLLHAAPALQKIRDGEQIRNPLLSQIKKDYEHLFQIVQSAVQRVKTEYALPDEEVGFLVMHFGAALERIRQISLRVRALIVCTSGIGSSKLLAMRIEKELPQIELLAHISWFEAARIPKDEYDLVISTVDLPLSADQYIKISPLLTKDEVEKLRNFIQKLTMKQNTAHGEMNGVANEQQGPAITRLTDIGLYSQVIVLLIEQFKVYSISIPRQVEKDHLSAILQNICEMMRQQGKLEDTQSIVERLIRREKSGNSQVISNSGLALFHTRSEMVQGPIVALFRSDRPLQWEGMQNEQTVRQILFMLGPLEMNKQTLEVLSEFSALLIEPGVIGRLESDDEESIKRFFSHKFELFIKNILEWRE